MWSDELMSTSPILFAGPHYLFSPQWGTTAGDDLTDPPPRCAMTVCANRAAGVDVKRSCQIVPVDVAD